MREMRGRSLQSAGLIREFVFVSTKALSEYLKTIRGNWYILSQKTYDSYLIVTIVTQYNEAPIWEARR